MAAFDVSSQNVGLHLNHAVANSSVINNVTNAARYLEVFDVRTSSSSEEEQHFLVGTVPFIVTTSDSPSDNGGGRKQAAILQQVNIQFVLSSSDSDDGYAASTRRDSGISDDGYAASTRRDSGISDSFLTEGDVTLSDGDDLDEEDSEREAVMTFMAAYSGLSHITAVDFMIAARSSGEKEDESVTSFATSVTNSVCATNSVTSVTARAIKGMKGSPDAYVCKVKVARTGILSGWLYTKISTLFEQLSDNGIDIVGDYYQYCQFVNGLMFQCRNKPDIQVLIMIENARVLYRLDKVEEMKRLCRQALKSSKNTRNASYLRCRALYVLAGAYRKQKKNHKSETCAHLALQEAHYLERGEDTAQARYNSGRQEMEAYAQLIASSGGNRAKLAKAKQDIIDDLLECMNDYQRDPTGLPNKQRRCYIRVAQILSGGFTQMRKQKFDVTLADLDEVRRKLLYVREHLWNNVTHRTRCSYLMAEGDLARHESHAAGDLGDATVAMDKMAAARIKFTEAHEIAQEHHFESERKDCEKFLRQLEE